MLSSAIVVFREVFEIVLIVGIVLAATRGIPGRGKAIGFGFAGGLIGSALVALFTDGISNFAEGMGQEYFNAGILFIAAGFIGWTVLWMKRHAREMKGHFMKVGEAVASGDLPYFSLSLVIGLAILREGSEIVLFSYGMLASGMSWAALFGGAGIGLVGGALVGGALYFGLIKLSIRWFFVVTSWLLVLLVAGMMLQGTGFLVAAGAFENLSHTVWDSSWLLEEGGIVGQSLGTLIGYTARPTAIQLIVYLLTLGTLIMLMRLSDQKTINTKNAAGTAAVILAALVMMPGQAQATKQVYTPYVEKGELEVEWKGRYEIDDDSQVDGKWVQKVAVGYGVTEYWFTEAVVEFEKSGASGADAETKELEWENKFQLTNPGEHFVDVGFLTELKYNTAGGSDAVEGKLLLAKDIGRTSHATNLVLEREFGEDSSNDTEAGFAWSSKYRLNEQFEPGFEVHSDFGSISDGKSYSRQKHMVGPVAYGHLGHFGYDVGVLFGVSDAAPDATLKAILEYEWYF
ncbi:MAG: hypothetical protein DHS20C02_04860 [Micavibrio sp.]|nr:MAG: hypothetical protein DHS20C02_04860 [Micavibrio sp.]